MKEINELNQRLIGAMNGTLPPDGFMIDRGGSDPELDGVPDDLRREIEELAVRIGRTIPDDFGYVLWLGEEEAGLTVEFQNGPLTGAFRGHPWDKKRSIFEQLESHDWNAEREWGIPGTEIFDEMAKGTKDIPSQLPSTKTLQRIFREEMKAFVKEKREDDGKVHALVFREEQGTQNLIYDGLEKLTQVPQLKKINV